MSVGPVPWWKGRGAGGQGGGGVPLVACEARRVLAGLDDGGGGSARGTGPLPGEWVRTNHSTATRGSSCNDFLGAGSAWNELGTDFAGCDPDVRDDLTAPWLDTHTDPAEERADHYDDGDDDCCVFGCGMRAHYMNMAILIGMCTIACRATAGGRTGALDAATLSLQRTWTERCGSGQQPGIAGSDQRMRTRPRRRTRELVIVGKRRHSRRVRQCKHRNRDSGCNCEAREPRCCGGGRQRTLWHPSAMSHRGPCKCERVASAMEPSENSRADPRTLESSGAGGSSWSRRTAAGSCWLVLRAAALACAVLFDGMAGGIDDEPYPDCNYWIADDVEANGHQQMLGIGLRPKPTAGATRYGEAEHPGPARDAIRANWGAFGAQTPHCGGFRDAVAPGFTAPEPDPADGDGERELYALRIATANVTAWGSAIAYLHDTLADVVLVQEHKLGERQADEAISWLRRRGWNAVMTPAVPGPNGGLSAGTAVLAKSHIGLGLPLVGSDTIVPGRAIAARVEAPGYRPMTVLSLYLHDGVGLDRTNLEVLRQVGAFLAAQGDNQPFVVGGDMQMTPQEFSHAAFARELGATIAASRDTSGTCRTFRAARELDYFIVKDCMCTGIDAVRTVPRTGIKTHLPVELAFRPRMASMRALTIRRPPPLATERIVGPIPHVVDWTSLAEEARTLAADARDEGNATDGLHVRLGDIFSRWADAAERELIEATVDGHNIPKTGLRGKAPVLVWKSVLPERPARAGGPQPEESGGRPGLPYDA